MSAQAKSSSAPPLDLSRWRPVPLILMVVGGIGVIAGWLKNEEHNGLSQFGYSWLLSFMFFLSLGLGGLFLVIVHHLFDASWSVPVRRVNEHLAFLLPVLALLWIPIGLLASKIYPWIQMLQRGEMDHALHAKHALFSVPMFYVIAAICFAVWIFLSWRLRALSLRQDQTGDPQCTLSWAFGMRVTASIGIFLFALTLTLGAIMWMKALQHQWFSTMYGVYYFAGSVWTTLATVYIICLLLKRQGSLRDVVQEKQFYFLGSLLFAFTVFYAYIAFSQYFIIWNANMPEETFWYVVREKGTWWQIGMIIIFGHFFIPFLSLLRIDVKLSWFMIPIGIWAWLMHFIDLSFNIMPVLHPNGYVLHWMDIACFLFMAGVLSKVFLMYFSAHAPFPQRDPRLAEGLDVYVPPVTGHAAEFHGSSK
jgi:hypothetical protein